MTNALDELRMHEHPTHRGVSPQDRRARQAEGEAAAKRRAEAQPRARWACGPWDVPARFLNVNEYFASVLRRGCKACIADVRGYSLADFVGLKISTASGRPWRRSFSYRTRTYARAELPCLC